LFSIIGLGGAHNIAQYAERCTEEWRHEYPPGTPREFIRDEILEC